MSKSKITKTETKAVTKAEEAKVTTKVVIKDDTKDGVIDTLYQNILDKAVTAYRKVQGSSLEWAYDLGELFVEFETTVAAKTPGRTVDVFIKDLAERDIAEVGASTLYFSKKVFIGYKRDALATMAPSGVGTMLVKLLFGLEKEPAILEAAKAYLVKADGTIVSTRDMIAFIAQKRQEVTSKGQQQAIETTRKVASETKRPAEAREERTKGNVVTDCNDDGGQDKTETESTKSPETPAKPDDGKTGSRGLTKEKEYSVSVQKVLKASEAASTKLIASLGDTIIAATEITKIGFNHPSTKDTVRALLAGCLAGIEELITTLPDVRQRVREALDDVSG